MFKKIYWKIALNSVLVFLLPLSVASYFIDRHLYGMLLNQLGLPTVLVQESMRDIRLFVAAVMITTLLVSFVLAYHLARRMTRPIQDMCAVAQSLAQGDLDQRVWFNRDDELGELGNTINLMADRLKEMLRDFSQEKNKMQTILTSMVDAMIAFDQVGRVILINKAGEEVFRVREEDALGRYVLEVIRNHELEASIKEVLEEGNIVSKELKLIPTSSRIYRVHIGAIKSEVNRIQGAVAVFRDITDVRNFDQMRSEFVANVSHELRTPLTSIKGFVETLMDGAAEDRALRQRFLAIIESETKRLNRLIDDLLTLSSIESKQREVQFRPLDLARPVKKVVAMLNPRAVEKQITIECQIPVDLTQVWGDEDLLGQVVINLIDNAIKYTAPGGKIILKAAANQDEVIVQVVDNGIGIPANSLNRLFERFYRVDKARSRELGGTGLGLAIVKHIVESHGGRVWVESEMGQGSTFSFTLRAVEGSMANGVH
ncbi:MAG: phosphate regulon sensor histidine kinase PhoR [Firmicutes bacterium]|nr:phosphate regulon sensor histidine kinase PhoR [Bacillota bacterium]